MILALLCAAFAQVDGADAHRVDARGPSVATLDADPRDPLWIRRPGTLTGGDAFVGGMLHYQRQPLTERVGTDPRRPLLDDVFLLDVAAGWAPTDWLRLDVVAPLYAFRGVSPTVDGTTPTGAAQGAGLADPRISALVQIVSPTSDERGLGVGVVPFLLLPTGRGYFGRGVFTGGADVVASYDLERVSFTASAGLQLDPPTDAGVPGGPQSRLGASTTWMVDEGFGLGAELIGGLPLHSGDAGIPLEGLVRARTVREDGSHLAVGVGVGLGAGVGTPAYRVFVGGGLGASGAPRDTDADGIVDADDACPERPETRNGLRDADGCPDALPILSVTATVDDVAIPGATIVLDGPEDRTFQTGAAPERVQVQPGTAWKATATQGACLRGEALATVDEADTALAVPLERVAYAEVEVQVFDPRGRPAAGALIEFTSDDPTCVPSEFLTVPPDGTVRAEVGPGRHRIAGTLDDLEGSIGVEAEEGSTRRLVLVLQ